MFKLKENSPKMQRNKSMPENKFTNSQQENSGISPVTIIAFHVNNTVLVFHINYHEKRWKRSDTRNAMIYISEFPAPPLKYMTKNVTKEQIPI